MNTYPHRVFALTAGLTLLLVASLHAAEPEPTLRSESGYPAFLTIK